MIPIVIYLAKGGDTDLIHVQQVELRLKEKPVRNFLEENVRPSHTTRYNE